MPKKKKPSKIDIDFNAITNVNGILKMHVFSGKTWQLLCDSFNDFFEKKDVELKEIHFMQPVSHDGFWLDDFSLTVIFYDY